MSLIRFGRDRRAADLGAAREKGRTQAEDQRERTRTGGRFSKMDPCPACGKPRAVLPAYSISEGGSVPDGSPWVGQMICAPCIRRERKRAGLPSLGGAMTLSGLSGAAGIVAYHATDKRLKGQWRTPLFLAMNAHDADYGSNRYRVTFSPKKVAYLDAAEWLEMHADGTFRQYAKGFGADALEISGWEDVDSDDRPVESGEMWVILDPAIITESVLVSTDAAAW